MEETFIISIYQKIELNDNILAFKRVGIAKNAKIKMDDDFSEAVFYDEDKKRVTLDYMETDYAFVSDDKYCYSYPVTLSELKEIYPESIAEEELIGSYLDEISKVINIAFYDEVSDKVKVFATNEKVLREKDEDELFTYLKEQSGNGAIKWNYTKFLVGRDGKLIRRYAPITKPEKMTDDVLAALNA